MAGHGQSAWIEDSHSGHLKGRYHVNALTVWLEGKEVGRKSSQTSERSSPRRGMWKRCGAVALER